MEQSKFIGLMDYWPSAQWVQAPAHMEPQKMGVGGHPKPRRMGSGWLAVDEYIDAKGWLILKVFKHEDHDNLQKMIERYGSKLPEAVKYIYSKAFQRQFVTMRSYHDVEPNINRAENSLHEFVFQDRAPKPTGNE
ncbi:MAG: hypothetical protein ACPGVN_08225 [Alphaproteobacteria bacterium]